MKPEEMIVGNWYIYKPYNWLFMFEKIIHIPNYIDMEHVLCYDFYYVIKSKNFIRIFSEALISTKELKDVVNANINLEDYIHFFPDDNIHKIAFIRNKKIKTLLNA